MDKQDFADYYKTISNAELVDILDNQGDYQQVAVAAAQAELSARKLTDTELKEAKEVLVDIQTQKSKQNPFVKAIETKVKSSGDSLLEMLNPVQPGISSTEKAIRAIVVFYTVMCVYQITKDFPLHIAYVKDFPRYPAVAALYLLPLIVLPIAIITFWKRKSVGWTLFAIYATFSAVGFLLFFIKALLWKPSNDWFYNSLYTRTEVFTSIIQLVLYGGTIFAITRESIRKVFYIGNDEMVVTITVTGVVSFFILYMYI